MLFKSTFISALLLIGAANFAARADIQFTTSSTYTFETKSPTGSQTSTSQEVTTHFISTNKERVEYAEGNLVRANEVTITRCDLNQQFRIDNALKIYTVSALDAKGILHEATKKELAEGIPSGKVVTDFSLQKMGSEKINGLDTQVYHFKFHTQYSGVLTNHEDTADGKMWVADVPGILACDAPPPLQASYTQIEDLPSGRRRVTYQNTGNFEKMNALSSRLIMRQEMSTNVGTVSEETTGYSTAKLDDALFEVPTGYRKVTLEEYQKLHSEAKIKAMRKSQDAKPQQ